MNKILALLAVFFIVAHVNAQSPTSILFIGNSYTYVNNLPVQLDSLATSLGKNVTTGSKTNGGFTFANHYNDPATFAAMHQQDWNVIVLQAQSQEPSFPTDQVNTSTLVYSNLLADSAYATHDCANVMYYMTWGREVGDPQWDSINTFDKMNQRLYSAYMRFADSADAMVSPVAVAWKYVRDNHPTIQLYTGDGSHPSLEGSYLAACTFYASVFQESPVGASYNAGLNPAIATILQQASAITILDSIDRFSLHPVDINTIANFELVANNLSIETINHSSHATTFEWNFGDGTTSTEANPTHTYAQEGNYLVRLIAISACNRDTVIQQANVAVVGINELNEIISILDFPNHYSVTAKEKTLSYSIVDIQGRIVYKGTIPANESVIISKIGSFGILRITDGNEEVIRKFAQ